MRWADARGDSFRLSVLAQDRPQAEFIVFCGVHFMAESADILTATDQQVILPDLNAGCSMADMADIDSGRGGLGGPRRTSSTSSGRAHHLHELVGRAEGVRRPHGGAVCTSTNARAVLEWAFAVGGPAAKVLFFPDQHLGRNTGVAMGYSLDDMRVWNPRLDDGRARRGRPEGGDVPALEGPLLGAPAVPADARRRLPPPTRTASWSVHPECAHEVCDLADQVGSTDFIIRAVQQPRPGR